MRRIAIIGGGAAGAWAAITLARRLHEPAKISVFEPRPEPGRGLAYSSFADFHCLNVPAWKMDVGHDLHLPSFVQWLVRGGHYPDENAAAGQFVARHLYGSYLAELFGCAGGWPIVHHRAHVTAAARTTDGLLLVSFDRTSEVFDQIVVATGNSLPRSVPWLHDDVSASRRFHFDPWNAALSTVRRGHVVIVGSGLTSIDVILSLRHSGHNNVITLVSRRGLLPLVDRPGTIELDWPVSSPPTSPSWLLHRLRREVERAFGSGIPWQAVVDRFRAASPDLWKSLSPAQQSSVWRHAFAYWSVHRQRIGPASGRQIEELRKKGLLVLVRGRMSAVTTDGASLRVEIRRPAQSETSTIHADHVVNCSGLETSPSIAGNGLLNQMVNSGLLADNPGGFGAFANDHGQSLIKNGNPVPGVFILGTLLRGHDWEAVSVPAIRSKVDGLVSFLNNT